MDEHSRRTTASWLGVAVATLAAVAAVALSGSSAPGAVSRLSAAGPAGGGRIDPAEVAERTVDGLPPLACAGQGPLEALAADPGAELLDTPEAAGLRDVIATDPTQGMSPQTPHNWVLLGRKGDVVSFGQRSGVIGIGATVSVERHGDRYTFAGSGGCGPVGYADGRAPLGLGPYADRGGHLRFSYTGGACDAPQGPRVVVHESSQRVDVLAFQPREVLAPGTVCLGVGLLKTLDVPIAQPLAGRQVRDLAFLPAAVLPVEPPSTRTTTPAPTIPATATP